MPTSVCRAENCEACSLGRSHADQSGSVCTIMAALSLGLLPFHPLGQAPYRGSQRQQQPKQPLRNLILGAQPEACTTTKHHHENHLISVRPRLLTRHTVTRCSAALTQMQQISSDPRLGNEDGTLAGMALLCVPRVISLWVRGSGRTLTTRSDEATAKAERRGRTADPSKNSIEILLHKILTAAAS